MEKLSMQRYDNLYETPSAQPKKFMLRMKVFTLVKDLEMQPPQITARR